jgi:threonine dehydrogenase-like Zn-dependent dehydrogenase
MKTAKAAVFNGPEQPFIIKEYELTAPLAGMAKMKLIASGICGTDIHIHRGKIPVPFPGIIGHEFVGAVEEISAADSAATGIKAGDRVIVDIACPCGECLLCKDGDDANCLNMGLTNGGDPETAPHFYGGYGEYNYSPIKNLIKIPDGVEAKAACVFACAGPTCLHAFGLAKKAGVALEKTGTAVVQGMGPVGAFAVMYLATLGITNIIMVTGRANTEKTAAALKLGATQVFSLEETPIDDLTAQIKEISGGPGADMVFEASGNPEAVPQGLGMLRNRGVYLIPGQYSNSGTVAIAPQMITFNALHIIGSSQYAVADVEAYLAFLQANPQLHGLVLSLASCYRVADTNEAIEAVKAGKNIKTMLTNG